MNFNIVHSLRHLAVIRIAITFCSQHDIRTSLYQFYFCLEDRCLEIEVKAKALYPSYPKALRNEIFCFIRPIVIQILEWMNHHDRQLHIYEKYLNNLRWTAQGTVDGKKTAEELIKEENLDIAERYILACVYCLEDNIPKLWSKLPENKKNEFLSENNIKELVLYEQKGLVLLWTCIVAGEEARINDIIKRHNCSPCQWGFKCAIKAGIKEATEYFLKKLNPEKIKESLWSEAVLAASKNGYFDVFCLIISNMNESKRLEVCKNYCSRILCGLLNWPWQDLYMESANRMWDFLPKYKYEYLLSLINWKIKNGYEDYDYENLFREFWEDSPCSYKKYVIQRIGEDESCLFTEDLWHLKNIKNLLLILKSATLAEKRNAIFSFIDMCFCDGLKDFNNWDLLTVFIRECSASQETIIELKEKLKDYPEEGVARNNEEWDNFLQVLDECIFEDDCMNRDDIPP